MPRSCEDMILFREPAVHPGLAHAYCGQRLEEDDGKALTWGKSPTSLALTLSATCLCRDNLELGQKGLATPEMTGKELGFSDPGAGCKNSISIYKQENNRI